MAKKGWTTDEDMAKAYEELEKLNSRKQQKRVTQQQPADGNNNDAESGDFDRNTVNAVIQAVDKEFGDKFESLRQIAQQSEVDNLLNSDSMKDFATPTGKKLIATIRGKDPNLTAAQACLIAKGLLASEAEAQGIQAAAEGTKELVNEKMRAKVESSQPARPQPTNPDDMSLEELERHLKAQGKWSK
jgi:hypothetical protein